MLMKKQRAGVSPQQAQPLHNMTYSRFVASFHISDCTVQPRFNLVAILYKTVLITPIQSRIHTAAQGHVEVMGDKRRRPIGKTHTIHSPVSCVLFNKSSQQQGKPFSIRVRVLKVKKNLRIYGWACWAYDIQICTTAKLQGCCCLKN